MQEDWKHFRNTVNEKVQKISETTKLLTRWGYPRCQVTVILDPETNVVAVEPCFYCNVKKKHEAC